MSTSTAPRPHPAHDSSATGLLDAARAVGALVDALGGCVARRHTTSAVSVGLANLHAGELRAALKLTRTVPDGGRR